jgi:hypothetical protein
MNGGSLLIKLPRIYGRLYAPLRSKRSKEGERQCFCPQMPWICGLRGLIESIDWTHPLCLRQGIKDFEDPITV